MRVTTVHFSKTKQVRPYEPERIELTIDLAEGDTVQDAIARARATCDALMGDIPDEYEVEQARLILERTQMAKFD